MLTKTDIKQIEVSVGKSVRNEVEAEGKNIRDELKSELISARFRIQEEVRELADRIKNLEIRINNLNSDTKNNFTKLDNRFTDLFDFLDKDVMKTKKRTERTEKHLRLEPLTP